MDLRCTCPTSPVFPPTWGLEPLTGSSVTLLISRVQPEDLQVYPCPRYLQAELSISMITRSLRVARTVNSESTVIFGIPVLVLLSRARSNDISCVLRRANM